MTTCVYENDVLFSESTLSYLLEAGPEVKQSALSKMIAKVKELLEKLKRFIQETVFKKRVKAVEDAVKKNPELGEKKVKVVDIDKTLKVEEEFVKDLKKAKTPADVEKAKAKRKKALKIVAAAAAAITIAAGLLHIKNTRNRVKSICDGYYQVIEYANESIRNSEAYMFKLATDLDSAFPEPDEKRYSLYQRFEDGYHRFGDDPSPKVQKMKDVKSNTARQLAKKHLDHKSFVDSKTDSWISEYSKKIASNYEKIAKSKKLYNEYDKTIHSVLNSIAESENTVLKSMDKISKQCIDALHDIADDN